MERVTKRVPYDVVYKLGKYTDTLAAEMETCDVRTVLNALADYEDAEEQGLLLRLPCKKGDKVYRIWSCGANGYSIAEFEIENIDICNLPEIEFAMRSVKNKYATLPYRFFKASDIGKTVFLTREAAESALAEKGGAV